MSLSRAANQTAVHEPMLRDGAGNPRYDSESQPLYGPPETIKVRKDAASGVKTSATGQDVDVETEYATGTVIALQDRVDGQLVRRVEEITSIAGKRLHFEFAV